MISFFKKLRSTGTKNEADVSASAGVEKVEATEQDVRPLMGIHFPKEFDNQFSQEERYVLQFFLTELPEIEEGQLAIDGYKIGQDMNGLVLLALLRNNTDAEIALEHVPLVLQDANHNTIARSVFDMSESETIPAYTAMLYRFLFPYSDFLMPQADLSSWSVGFHMEDGSIRQAVSELDFESAPQVSMQDYVEKRDQQVMDEIKKAIEQTENQVNFIGTTIQYTEDGSLVAELFLRNGRSEEVTLEKDMTFTLRDAANDVVASRVVDMSQMKLSPKSVTRWTLTYDKASQKKENPDFSEWVVEVK
jgi:SLAP domain-containing protein